MVSSLLRNLVKKWRAARSSRNSNPKKKTRTSSKRGRNEATQPMSFLVPSNLIVRKSVKTDIIFQAFTHPTTWNRKEYSHWKITLFRILYWISRSKRIQQKIGGCELHIPFWTKLPGALPAFIYRAVLQEAYIPRWPIPTPHPPLWLLFWPSPYLFPAPPPPPLPPGCILSWATFWICLQTRPWCRTELLCRCLSRGVITIFCFAMPSGYWGVWIEISLQQFLWQCMPRVWFPKGSP